MARGEHSAGLALNDRMKRLLRRKLKAAAKTALGRKPPRRLLVRAAAIAPITDAQADDWGGFRVTRHFLSR
jgi:hypothetical protein